MAVLDIFDAPRVNPREYGGHIYVEVPEPLEFPAEEPWEDKVPETKRHMLARTMLYLLLQDAFPGVALGSDQFVYFDPRDPRKNLSPDLFAKVGADNDAFDTWKVWERGAPDLAVEIVSDWDHPDREWADKVQRYEACGIRELVRFDPDDRRGPIRIWDRVGGRLLERSQDDPNLRACGALGCFWVVAPSDLGPELRLARDREGRDLFPTPNESRVRLESALAEERKARAEAEHERTLERAERERAEQERARAEEERTRAEEERTRAEEARAQAERERDAALAELARLRAERGK